MRKLFVLAAVVFIITTPCFALDFENVHTFRYDWRGSDGGDIYLCEARLKSSKFIDKIDRDLDLIFLCEEEYSFDRDQLNVARLGAAAGMDFFKWLYWEEDIHYAWYDTESDCGMLRSKFTIDIPFSILNFEPSLVLFEEHSFNLNEGCGARNDVGANIKVPFTEGISCKAGWYHTDRIHSFDTDYFETKLDLTF